MSSLNTPMNNLSTLIAAGVIPQNLTLAPKDIEAINSLSADEVNTIIALKTKLGTDFLKNTVDAPNCFL
jgi:hypothetical protein